MSNNEIHLLALALYWRWQYTESNPDVGWTTIEIIFSELLHDPKVTVKPTDSEIESVLMIVKGWTRGR